jgi:hypothetical protein
VSAVRAAIDAADSDPPAERKRLAYRLDRHRGPPLTLREQKENIKDRKSSLEAAVIEYPNVPGPELRRIMAGLGRDYLFYLCTMTFPDYCEDVVARMIEFGKPLQLSARDVPRSLGALLLVQSLGGRDGVSKEIRRQYGTGL